eukprot:CAMPEP_0181325966 /NCGR_PEP_ID=MMETSP1101-20121128/21226_1 /TAXON_ID=46948 /ORGANISM="Rhodomonas abbreviata, Strain Caron Lab Isolate" /LENGTH=250 /DNA_ID=CAMNT_0023434347 /DNA_START=9 /DNA_END=761 /DNA_ORIENTATION=+
MEESTINTHDEIERALTLLSEQSILSEQTILALREAAAMVNAAKTLNSSPRNDEDATNTPAGHRPFKPSNSKKQQLTAEEAAEIYMMRPKPGVGGLLRRGSMLHCKTIAPKYGVTAKTIRDVWSGRSWVDSTRHLWTKEEEAKFLARGSEEEKEEKDEKSSTTPSPIDAPKLPLSGCQPQLLGDTLGSLGCIAPGIAPGNLLWPNPNLLYTLPSGLPESSFNTGFQFVPAVSTENTALNFLQMMPKIVPV